jgi:chromosome segregation ATPase
MMDKLYHEKLFDEISGKLQELTVAPREDERMSERLEQMQIQIRRSQEELKATKALLQEKIQSMDSMNFASHDSNREVKRLSEQLDQERINSSKLSTELAKSLELNLRLQYEIEEVRAKTNQGNEKLEQKLLEKETTLADLQADLDMKTQEIQKANESLAEYDQHLEEQNELMKKLFDVAEKKMIELKMALDKKTIESQDYYSNLQQGATQIQALRQENSALKDYFDKVTALHRPITEGPRA